MESFGQKTHRLIGLLLLLFLLLMTGGAAYLYYISTPVRALAQRADTSLYMAVLTKPAMVAAYNPRTRKIVLTTLDRKKIPSETVDNAQDLFQQAGLEPKPMRYYLPIQQDRDEYWEKGKENLTSWHNKPFVVLQLIYDYVQAYRQKRTNIPPAEFLLYSLEGAQLEVTDFTVQHPEDKKKKKRNTPAISPTSVEPDRILPLGQDLAPLAVKDRPLVIEVLNASGIKGAAADLTQYLRQQAEKGLLQVDVLQHDNYPGGRQKKTRIVNYKGKLDQLKQLSTAMGLNNEIVQEKQDTAICDARVIIGEDFKQPF